MGGLLFYVSRIAVCGISKSIKRQTLKRIILVTIWTLHFASAIYSFISMTKSNMLSSHLNMLFCLLALKYYLALHNRKVIFIWYYLIYLQSQLWSKLQQKYNFFLLLTQGWCLSVCLTNRIPLLHFENFMHFLFLRCKAHFTVFLLWELRKNSYWLIKTKKSCLMLCQFLSSVRIAFLRGSSKYISLNSSKINWSLLSFDWWKNFK